MSVDFELEPNVQWGRIEHEIKSGRIPGVTIQDHRKGDPWKKDKWVHLLVKGNRSLYAFDMRGDGVLFKEFGSRWSSTHPIMEMIAKRFKAKYYNDLDEETWNRHVERTSKPKPIPSIQSKPKQPSKRITPKIIPFNEKMWNETARESGYPEFQVPEQKVEEKPFNPMNSGYFKW